ncbi:Reverse transcriptase (RNA-dependent DNA polymerase) [Bacillus sp. B-jedd]|nr:Reverse transcriptase (RNA-dependent DNA polymerase) [Bacillus sp. B-jedd]
MIEDLNYFFKFCNIESLPQFHFSIASSLLSQLYLTDFDNKVRDLLAREELQLIRYVDDMYLIFNDSRIDRKKKNSLLNELSYYLWEDRLTLNTSKTKMLSPNEFKNIIELPEHDYEVNFLSEKLVEDKALEVVENGHLNELVNRLCTIEKKDGVDLEQYKKLSIKYLSINEEDVNKVLRNIIYSNKWKKLDETKMKELVANWKYILFNPAEFTVLYILVYRYLEEGRMISDNGSKIKQILNFLFKNNVFTFRDTLVAVSYLFQSKVKNQDLLNKIALVNADYVEYLELFVKDSYK